jgi:hypothetical protein
MGKIIIAPHKEIPEGILVYLAGPQAYMPDWQSDAIAFLQINDSISIASPREARDARVAKTSEEQILHLEWEQYYREYAYQRGVMICWFPKQQEGFSQSKAMIEFGEVFARAYLQNAHLLVGIEPGFEGETYIRNLLASKKPAIDIAETLEMLCEKALIAAASLQ